MPKVTDLTELAAAPAATDMFLVSEISSGLSKKINFSRMISGYRNFTTGAWTIPAPSSGVTLTLGGIAATSTKVLSATGSTTGSEWLQFDNTSGQVICGVDSSAGGLLGTGTSAYSAVWGTGLAQSAHAVTNGIVRTTWSSAGNVTIAAPSSGKALAVDGEVTVASGTATPAGGTAGKGLTFGTTANLGVFFGSGAPTLSAAQGSLYIRTDGSSTSTRLYVNTTGSTVWTNVTTAT